MGVQTTLFHEESKIKALDELFASSATYRSSSNFFDLLKFINKFPSLSPFNAFLIHMQNSGVEVVMSAKKWNKHGRSVKYKARPMVILVPFGPVDFVYDIADTEGEPIPATLINPFTTNGSLPDGLWERTVNNIYRDRLVYREDTMHKSSAGYASSRKVDKFDVVVNSTYDLSTKYSTLVHELAHVYAGHLGVLPGNWWIKRTDLDLHSREIEAESISYLACSRVGLQTASDSYLSTYIKQKEEMPPISLDVILTVAGYIEQLGQKGFKPKKGKKF